MTRTEQERLVERYLGGEMSSSDEEEFFIQVAVDSDLRQTLKAYRIVESAIRKHRESATTRHTEARTRLLTMLSMQPNGQPLARSEPAPIPRARAQERRRERKVAVISTASLRWAFAAVTMVALSVGVYVIAPLINGEREAKVRPENATIVRPDTIAALPAPHVTLTEAPAPAELPSDGSIPVTGNAGEEKPARPSENRMRRSARPSQTAGIPARQKARPSSGSGNVSQSAMVESAPEVNADAPIVKPTKKRPRLSVTDSTIKVRVRVELPK